MTPAEMKEVASILNKMSNIIGSIAAELNADNYEEALRLNAELVKIKNQRHEMTKKGRLMRQFEKDCEKTNQEKRREEGEKS